MRKIWVYVLGAAPLVLAGALWGVVIAARPHPPQAATGAWRPVPSVPPLLKLGVGGEAAFTAASLAKQPGPLLVVFTASWCVPCRTELPALHALASKMPLWAVLYHDSPERYSAALRHDHMASPFCHLRPDPEGAMALEWGVSGVPELFLLKRATPQAPLAVAWHGSGPLDGGSIQHILHLGLEGGDHDGT
ncbi:thioredoxin domain-containing protein [Formicincola oecophyllae]|uniref:thioredoxin domain-containing protein n=1 Tax=Formicincola oecophyllae TaxID=2558361 RepID=UPI00143CD58F|nr:thioredoxin domain-containing protein [Formicincola oecophyllae]